MKKLLAIIGGASFVVPTVTNVISCDPGDVEVFAPAGTDLNNLFSGDKLNIQIYKKSNEGLMQAIKNLKIVSSQQIKIDGEVDSRVNEGKVKLIPNEDFFIKVEGFVEVSWFYIEDTPNTGGEDTPNTGGEDEISEESKNNNLTTIQNKFDSNTNFHFQVNQNTNDPNAEWSYIKGVMIGVFNSIVGESFGIPEHDRWKEIVENVHYKCDYDEVIATKELKPNQKISINFWGLEDSWINGKAIITIILN
ncbi:hypothetical protein SCHIN_v1c05970 [Spiroplasma chinense]|uniref:Lipoprotein n=1 Tax=Spiroplasma chinense TaxID=216932 RepID=A0A5B9Y3Z9_9MOLU|nr:lipoprotein [Spiroplasma chinense]QEH61794.1 hypothetical protein SCHIN_v1c05970 [Spiroplasma chinense]